MINIVSRGARTTVTGLAMVLVATLAPPEVADADPSGPPPSRPAATVRAPADRATVAADRDRLLPGDWRTSSDLAWTTYGDSTGLHLLVADSKTGYSWRTAATLVEPTIESDQWVGNACVTASGTRAVVVYQPRHFTNRGHLFDRGAFAAVVDLRTGTVTKLDLTVSIAYYNPGCGAGETAVLTQSGAVDLGMTRVHLLDVARARIDRSHELTGQVTSAVPLGGRIAAATGGRIIAVDARNVRSTLATTQGVAAYLRPDSDGGLSYLTPDGPQTSVARRVKGGVVTELARGPQADLGLSQGAHGQVFLTGTPAASGALPARVRRLRVAADTTPSTLGQLAVAPTGPTVDPAAEPTTSRGARSFGLRGTVVPNGRTVDFRINPGTRPARGIDQGRRSAPPIQAVASAGSSAQAAGSPTSPVDDDRYCAVPRNDVGTQVEQPHWRQVEWAADLAVRGDLTVTRPANWRQSGLRAWSPQVMYAPVALEGGGRVPAQVLLGILAQESNLWQASFHALEGVPGNPLVGNFYGVRDLWLINWSQADCGYGVGQVTDGMRLAGHEKPGETVRPAQEQRAIAIDYATNIAAGLRILQEKWNQTYRANIKINDADPSRPENWFAAVWAYNSGLNPQATTGNTSGCTPGPTCTDGARGNWGLGWGNNPANPDYPYNRLPFLNGVNGEGKPADAANPQRWPYPEKIMGWAAFPIIKSDFRVEGSWEPGYLQAWWSTASARTAAIKPPLSTFCRVDRNNCTVNALGQGSCGYTDYHCWWHWPASWKDNCADTCGHENVQFAAGAPEPARGSHYPPTCVTHGLPANALVVDDVPDSVGVVRSDVCHNPLVSRGAFSWQFRAWPNGLYPSKRDLHQLGSGIDGHFWFSHEYNPAEDSLNAVGATGTWRLGQRLDTWARVLVHMPRRGGESQQAHYTVDRGADTPAGTRFKTRTLAQRQGGNVWVSLGVFEFHGTAAVSLSNITRNESGLGTDNVAWDAIAFEPLPGKPRDIVVALGESFSSGEGASESEHIDYYHDSNNDGDGSAAHRNGCHRSKHAWSRQAFLKADPHQRTIGARADALDPTMDYHLVACSGAKTQNLLPSGQNPISGQAVRDPATGQPYANAWGRTATGALREVSQLDKGFLDENTTLVTLSIGGNDAGWGDAVRNCVLLPVDCRYAEVDGEPANEHIPSMLRTKVRQSVATVLRAVSQLAPNAKILLMGYPELMSDGASCLRLPPEPGYGIAEHEAEWMNELARMFATVLGEVARDSAAAGIRVRFADPIANLDFIDEGVCGDPETIHGFVTGLTAGENPDAPISQQSFHPKISGAANYATTLDRELRNWGL